MLSLHLVVGVSERFQSLFACSFFLLGKICLVSGRLELEDFLASIFQIPRLYGEPCPQSLLVAVFREDWLQS